MIRVEMIVPEEATHHGMWFHKEADGNKQNGNRSGVISCSKNALQ